MEDKTLCFFKWTLCKKRNIRERWKIQEEVNLKGLPILLVLWVKVGAAANVHPWWGLLLKDLQSYRFGNWVHLAQRESRYWGKQNWEPEEQHCCYSRILWNWHVFKDYLLYPLGLIRILQYKETLILFVLKDVPKKLTYRMQLEPRCTGWIINSRQPLSLHFFLVVSFHE